MTATVVKIKRLRKKTSKKRQYFEIIRENVKRSADLGRAERPKPTTRRGIKLLREPQKKGDRGRLTWESTLGLQTPVGRIAKERRPKKRS